MTTLLTRKEGDIRSARLPFGSYRGDGKVDPVECGRDDHAERARYSLQVRGEIDEMDANHGLIRGHAPRYTGRNPWMRGIRPIGDEIVNMYSDTGRVPFIWLHPVMLTIDYRDG